MYPWEMFALLRGIRQSVISYPTLNVELMDRDYCLVRLLYDTWSRVHEVLAVQVQDVELGSQIIHLKTVKGKAIMERKDGVLVHVDTEHKPRVVDISQKVTTALIRVIDGRKTGPLFVGAQKSPLTNRAAQKIIDEYARKVSIDGVNCLQARVDRGNETTDYLISPKAIREYAEWEAIHLGGMDRRTAAAKAGHSTRTQGQYYDRFASLRTVLEGHRARGELDERMREWRGDE